MTDRKLTLYPEQLAEMRAWSPGPEAAAEAFADLKPASLIPDPPPAPRRRRVYIAGPISSGDLAANVNRATDAFVALAGAGLAPRCPHWSVFSRDHCHNVPGGVVAYGTAAGAPGLSHADWLDLDLAWVGVAEAVLRLPGPSKGGDLEVSHAVSLGIPVFYSAEDVIHWARTHP